METGHFFRQICHFFYIAAPGGNGDPTGFIDLERKFFENGDHFFVGYVGAQQGVDFLRLQFQNGGVGHIVQNIDYTVHHFAGAEQFHQFAGAVDSGQSVENIQALFKFGAGLGAHAQRQGALADAGAVEVGGFKHHIHGVGDNF